MAIVKKSTFIDLCHECEFNTTDIRDRMKDLYPGYNVSPARIEQRLANYRRKGLLPLSSGNSVSSGEILKGSSTLYDGNGKIKQQWLKTDVPKEQHLNAFRKAISDLSKTLPSLPSVQSPVIELDDNLATLYISNDVHFGALMWDKESGKDWNVDEATKTLQEAYDYLFSCSPDSKVGIICDLGDLTEVDDYKNMTPNSGNVLAVDSRYPKILRAAYEALIYAVNKALDKHEIVYFYNISGNHDVSTGDAVREIIRVAFMNNPRVIVDETPRPVKYHQHGSVLLQFAHGDGLKMAHAGEVMAADCREIFSSVVHAFSHFGHNHKDSVIDTRLCRVESHRNLAPLNAWAYHKGYRTQLGTMKSITYHVDKGEISRNLFTL